MMSQDTHGEALVVPVALFAPQESEDLLVFAAALKAGAKPKSTYTRIGTLIIQTLEKLEQCKQQIRFLTLHNAELRAQIKGVEQK